MECGLDVLHSSACEQAQAFEPVEFGVPPALADLRGCRQRLRYRCERRVVIAGSSECLGQQPETVGAPQFVRTGFLPVGEALADVYDRVCNLILRRQNSTAQNARIEEEREALLGRQGLGRGEAPPGASARAEIGQSPLQRPTPAAN